MMCGLAVVGDVLAVVPAGVGSVSVNLARDVKML
jgi:hypothetical protein